ncbi:MAG: ArsR/SmtB family transcription factor [Lautropia sp.]
MITTNQIARIGLLIGEPARTAMLVALMHGQALTAGELARSAGVTASTASEHLAQLVAAGMLTPAQQGRHRYYRLASPEVARLLEQMMQLAGATLAPVPRVVPGPRDEAMRRARTCFDHLAGRLGVGIADAMQSRGFVELGDGAGSVTVAGFAHLARHGIPVDAEPTRLARNRPLCRPCLDWSERRPHLAGTLGATLCRHFLREGWVRRVGTSRALAITPAGDEALYVVFGIRSVP